MNNSDNQDLISALADGQLQGEDFARAVEVAAEEGATWQAYHLIGDVLRSSELAGGTPQDAFLARLREGLRREAAPVRPPVTAELSAVMHAQRPAANDSARAWKIAAGFATVAAMTAVGWNLAGSVFAPAQPQLAAAPAATPVATADRGGMIRDPRLDQFLAAHRQFGGANALQAPAGFLRNATFESPSR
jgi:sigma-E factor negative regulatory protein RseA